MECKRGEASHADLGGGGYLKASSSVSTSSPLLFQSFLETSSPSFQITSACFWPFSCHNVVRPERNLLLFLSFDGKQLHLKDESGIGTLHALVSPVRW